MTADGESETPAEPTRAIAGAKTAPIHEALADELARFEHYSLRLWQMLGSLGLLIGIYMTLAMPGHAGQVIVGIAAVYLLYSIPVARRIKKHGFLRGWQQLAGYVIEGSVPWTLLIALTFAQGAEYALASWAPAVLFCMILFQNALRLRAEAIFVVGISGAFVFLGLWVGVIAGRLPDEPAANLLYSAPMQISRFVLLILISVMTGFGARFLRAAIIRAEEVARSKDLFGKYRLLRTVARGGMGEVIEALYCPEGGFERRVAIKRIHEHLAGQPRFVKLFRTEAELCSRLAHPNIVQVMDFGRIQDTYFLAMEYVDGMTLGQLLSTSDRRGQPLPEHVVGAIMRDVLDGLHHAHRVARGQDGGALRVVHRDLCPQNILVSRNGEVKISDFGVARALKDAESSDTRNVVGHTAYLAPEQARALSIDGRIDLFAAGVIVWELLTGRRLFLKESDAATVLSLLNDPVPPVGTYRDGLDPGWDAFIRTALERDRERRFQTASDMTAAMNAIPRSRKEGATKDLAAIVERMAGEPGSEEEESDTRGATQTFVEGGRGADAT